ncbi:MAG: peptidoglycan editing factor PgeF [Gammaproteobacteria bacterium]|nr:peptidoglycan editing factor PgeF [Gammaproteobacteria bacterium]
MTNIIRPAWHAPDRVTAFCTTRCGGASIKPFDTFNLALHVGDDEQSVSANRGLLSRLHSLPAEPCWLNQTHSTRAVTLGNADFFNTDVDAAITREPGKVAVVMTADCLPVLICNQQGNEVAAIHAGWRGLADGILRTTLDAMVSTSDELLAWVGPAISQQHFEVGDEVRQLFLHKHTTEAAHRFIANRPGHWLCDLPGLAADELHRQGLGKVYLSALCSYDDDENFYSYRREDVTGRMASLIWINPTT